MNNDIKVKVKDGFIWATESMDIDYPGIDIEFVADKVDEKSLSRPRVLFEYPQNGKLRLLIWNDKNSEDYSQEIIFNI